jgi:hypothetical protein
MSETFSIQLAGETLIIDLLNYPRLLVADKKELNNYKILGSNQIIEWPDLDEQLSVRSIKEGKHSKETASSFVRWLRKREEYV